MEQDESRVLFSPIGEMTNNPRFYQPGGLVEFDSNRPIEVVLSGEFQIRVEAIEVYGLTLLTLLSNGARIYPCDKNDK